MLKNTSLLLFLSTLHGLAANISEVLVSLYIWRLADFQTLLAFKLFEVAIMPVTSFIVAWLGDRFSPKTTLQLGLALFATQMLIIVLFQEKILQFLPILALISGSSIVTRYMSLNSVFQTAIAPKSQPPFYGNMDIIFSILRVLFPFVSGAIIWQFGYVPLFIIGLASILSAFFLIIPVKIAIQSNPFEPMKLITDWNQKSTAIFFGRLWWGVEYGFFLTLIPILVTLQLNGELGWGILTAILSFSGVVAALYIKNKIKMDRRISLFKMGGILLSVAALMYSTIPSFDYLLFLLILLQLWQVMQNTIIRPMLNGLVRAQQDAPIMVSEYSYLAELPFAIGCLLIYGCLWILAPAITNPVVIAILFMVISIVPVNEVRSLLSAKGT